MIEQLRELIHATLLGLGIPGDLLGAPDRIGVERPKNPEHGDFSSNIALVIAKPLGRNPRELASDLSAALEKANLIRSASVAGPGFVNLFVGTDWMFPIIRDAATSDTWWHTNTGRGASVLVEFVSINPTGALHVAHGRNAAVGDAVARLHAATGWRVSREYYLNDAGNQLERFLESISARYRQLCGVDASVPEDGYVGESVLELAKPLKERFGDSLLSDDAALVEAAREFAYPLVVAEIEATCERFGVVFDRWFSERKDLHETGRVTDALERLESAGLTYRAVEAETASDRPSDRPQGQGEATWFRATRFGDDRDRVLLNSDGRPSYLLADIAYHLDKLDRGFTTLIDVWGADHHGQVPSLRAGLRALGTSDDQFHVVLHQFVHLIRDGEVVAMSKRSGNAVSLDELLDEVGVDAARYLFLRNSVDTTVNFDLEVAKATTLENPVYYVQYAHARINSILTKAAAAGLAVSADADLSVLVAEPDGDLMRAVAEFPKTVADAASNRTPHRIAGYAEELSRVFHRFYAESPVLNADDPAVTAARLLVCAAAKRTLASALGLLGVSAPESMERLGDE